MRHRPFTTFVAASGLTNLADGVAVLVWGWMASLLTRDPLLISLVPVALRIPWVICALPAGIVTDRVDRRHLILAMDTVRKLLSAATGIAIRMALPLAPPEATGISAPGLFAAILVAAAAVGVAEVFRDNAAQTMLPAIAPHAALERANGRLWSVELVGNALLGPALGAFLIAWSLPAPFLANALAYALAVLLVLGLTGRFRPGARPSAPDWRRELREAAGFLRAVPLLRTLAVVTGLWNLFFQMVLVALLLHVQENLQLGARAYGLILAAGALGGIAGGWWGGAIIRVLGPGRAAQLMLAASPLAFLGIALASGPVLLGVVLAAFNFTGLVWNTVSVSWRQRRVPDALLGRVNSLYRLIAWGMMPVGMLASGLIVRLGEGAVARDVALVLPFLVACVGSALLTLAGWRALGRGFATEP